jgi:hypothetical protein
MYWDIHRQKSAVELEDEDIIIIEDNAMENQKPKMK